MAMPASAAYGLYTPGFSTAGMGLTPQVAPATPTTTPPASTPTTPSTENKGQPTSATPASSAVTGGSSKNKSIAKTAHSLIGLNSKEKSPPETQDGKLACAWFVNEVLKKVYGHTFPKKGNTLLVDTVVADLKEEGATEVSPSNLKAGDIVYVPGKHIGIIADDGGKHIIHNSSSKGIAYKTKGATFESYKGQPHLYLRPKSA
jgi:cell wall-associated NlpC family hydrolase